MSIVIVTQAPPISVFTPPASCSSVWTYEDSSFNNVAGGLMLQNALPSPLDSDCIQSGVTVYGRVSHVEFYSPGACPLGYSTPVESINDGTTSIICCQSSFSYISTTVSQDVYAGCISTFPHGNTTAILSYDSTFRLTAFTTLTGPVTMWAQPLQFAYNQLDLSYFTTSTSSITTPTTSAQPSSTATSLPTPTSSLSTSTPTPTGAGGPSSGVIVGIGVGIALGVLVLVCFGLAFFLLRRRKQKAMSQKPAGDSSQEIQMMLLPNSIRSGIT